MISDSTFCARPTRTACSVATSAVRALSYSTQDLLHLELTPSRSAVTFKDLTVLGEGSGVSYGPSLTGAIKSIPALPKMIAQARHPKTKVILDGFTGDVRCGMNSYFMRS